MTRPAASQLRFLMRPELLNSEIAAKALANAQEARSRAARRLADLPHGTRGSALQRRLGQCLNALRSEIAARLAHHSKHFLVYCTRRAQLAKLGVWAFYDAIPPDSYEFSRLVSHHYWWNHRLTLAALRYGHASAPDMVREPPESSAGPYVTRPVELPDSAMFDVHSALFLMEYFEEVRYQLKRAGKGGYLVRLPSTDDEYDVIFEPERDRLVALFDFRNSTNTNLLASMGSWAMSGRARDFPLPDGGFIPLSEWPGSDDTPADSVGRLDLLTLIPNVAGVGSDLGWQTSEDGEPAGAPAWLFQWWDLESLLPRIELFEGPVRKHIELLRRDTGYDPADLIFALAAFTLYQREWCASHRGAWYHLFSRGYTLLPGSDAFIEYEILPRFLRIKERLHSVAGSIAERDRLNACVRALSWHPFELAHIDLLDAQSSRLMLPLATGDRLFDWSATLHVLLSHLELCGTMTGTLAQLRGREFQEAVGDWMSSNDPHAVWWRGERAGMLRFADASQRDLDLGIVAGKHLLVVECKGNSCPRRLLVVGEPRELADRWESLVLPNLAQVDSLTDRLCAEPTGRNFGIPSSVDWIVPVVCTPSPEWIPETGERYWLYPDIPRVVLPGELPEICNRLRSGQEPLHRVRLASR